MAARIASSSALRRSTSSWSSLRASSAATAPAVTPSAARRAITSSVTSTTIRSRSYGGARSMSGTTDHRHQIEPVRA